MVKIGFWNLYAVQRVGEWVGMSLLTFPFLLLDNASGYAEYEDFNLIQIMVVSVYMCGVIFIISGWLLVSLLSFFLYRRFKLPRSYALASMMLSAFWSGLWLCVFLLAGSGAITPVVIAVLTLWLLGLTSNYFVALYAHRWLIRWPDPFAA